MWRKIINFLKKCPKTNIYCSCKIIDDNFHTICVIGSCNMLPQNIRIAEM